MAPALQDKFIFDAFGCISIRTTRCHGFCPDPHSTDAAHPSCPICSRDAAGVEAAHEKERTTAALDCCVRPAKAAEVEWNRK